MNRKGFTLVELLATLVILAIVAGLSVYSIGNIFSDTKEKSEDVFVGTIKDALDMYISSDAKELEFSTVCSNKLNKTFGSRAVYKKVITFSDVINSQYKPIATSDLVNPANKDVLCNNASDIDVTIYRDEDYVYYYSVAKSEFGCLLNIPAATSIATGEEDLSIITNLPEGFVCS